MPWGLRATRPASPPRWSRRRRRPLLAAIVVIRVLNLLCFVQWVAAGVVAPVAGLGGERTAVPMALLLVGGAGLSMVGLLVVARPGRATTSGGA